MHNQQSKQPQKTHELTSNETRSDESIHANATRKCNGNLLRTTTTVQCGATNCVTFLSSNSRCCCNTNLESVHSALYILQSTYYILHSSGRHGGWYKSPKRVVLVPRKGRNTKQREGAALWIRIYEIPPNRTNKACRQAAR